ncbi:sensor histidine kinase [Olleya sp. HaHaR_3_96]|uniref:sensor histidine kinase n=1 Tax=Olleya sp. HaHaR_3_96 TaxID=2745560 RepID=UPI001C4F23FE|nr:HAMP domain-containing sensor histidine kinase [Olleya sp. HaHaR_3_96]QXP61483.1 PAS domain S-box protein [Olleya sp. HaHaR_3_96]
MLTDSNQTILSDEIHDKDFLTTIENSLAIGSWELDVITNTLKWSSFTKKIHEVNTDYIPDVEHAINFYKEGIHREKITKLFNNALENGKNFDDEFIIITAKGNEKWIRSIGHPKCVNGKCTAVRGVFQDITTKTIENKKTILKEKQFRSLFNYSLTGMALLSLEGNWLKVNHGICKILGYTEKEFLESNFLKQTHLEDKEIGEKELKLMLSGQLDNHQIEKRYLHKNGSSIHCILSLIIVRDVNGDPKHFIANINDVSEIKNGQKKITDLLKVTSKQNDRLINFAHIVSHNLRSHGGNLDMLLKLKKEEYPESITNEYFPLIEKAVDNLNETIQNLNDVALYHTLDNNKLESLNLLHYTSNALKTIKGLTIANSVQIDIAIDQETTIKAIPAYLDSIIINFLTNAIKYKRPTVNPIIKIEALKKDNRTLLTITDNGQGIDLEKHGNKLFGMYNVFHKHKDARGLGLFIVKNQIEAIGGKINVESVVGKGTKFIIHFNHD